MRRAIRRAALVTTVAALCAGAGSALFASTASAQGGVQESNGWVWGGVNNLTPYPLTVVASRTPPPGGWIAGYEPPLKPPLQPGRASVYVLSPYNNNSFLGYAYYYSGWYTYKADVVGAPPEYLTIAISQCYCTGTHSNEAQYLNVQVFNTVAPPPSDYDPVNQREGPIGVAATPNPQIGWSQADPVASDVTFLVKGKFTIDASTDQGQPFADLLNSVCSAQSGLPGTSCSFTQTTPITYGPGPLGNRAQANNCLKSAAAGGGKPPPGGGDEPPPDDPQYHVVEYAAAQSASLSVGGGATAALGIMATEISVSIEAEHEWEEVKTYTREAKVYIPSNSWGFLWWAPTVGRVTGTFVAKIGAATYTATNLTQVRTGVTGTTDPLNQPTPAFNVVTDTRPMTASEHTFWCGASSSSARVKARGAAPPAGLRAGRSVGRVALGETQEAVLARLGWPAEKRFQLEPCRGMPGCTAVRGLHGTWNYKRRKLSVVFGPDRRVAALIHSGNRRTADGVGKGSMQAAVRGKFPGVACLKFRKRIDCAVRRVSGGRTVRTVFRLKRHGLRWETKKVLIYVDGRGQVNS
jgi:hypothetical protein